MTMPRQINAAVGAASSNRRPDVQIIQTLLAQHGILPGRIDGLCGPLTVAAILRFQRGFLSAPDGRVDPHGRTWHQLTRSHAVVARPVPRAASGAPRPVPIAAAPPSPAVVPPVGGAQNLVSTVPRPAAGTINAGLTAVSPSFMVEQLGNPRSSYTSDCQPMTNAALKAHVVTQSVGRFRATGLRPAVESLAVALAQVQREQPAVYAVLGTAGMMCCRLVRGSATAISNHSWGTAIDFTLNGVLDRRGDNRVQVGLTLIASIMNQHGWYWGAAFRTEDATHFEASRALISAWAPTLQ